VQQPAQALVEHVAGVVVGRRRERVPAARDHHDVVGAEVGGEFDLGC
jgi:hypothetical protein